MNTKPITGLYLLVFLSALPVRAQESRWFLSASAGVSLLPLKQVNEDNERDIQGWNELGVPIKPFPALNTAYFLSGKVMYRFSPYGAFSLAVSKFSREVQTEYTDQNITLMMRRSVGSADLTAGVIQYLPQILYPAEWYVELRIGYADARARAEAHSTLSVEIDDTTLVGMLVDSDAVYSKTKSFAAVGVGMKIPLVSPLVMSAEVHYKNILVGNMEGEVTEFGEEYTEVSSIKFDYSGLFICVGLGVEF
ncbi:MAG: hypothetical protein JSW54_06055 [Fidelibacterota bacterium]|nr:MAG: hypothetical protein JSW54_06055 [Candidatus Neomarinimicrobiota bacterium]